MLRMDLLLPHLALDLPLAVKFYDSGVWTAAALGSLITLTILEVILGIDNVVFIAILTGKLPEEQRPKAQKLGIGLAAGLRILLLCGAAFVLTLDKPEYGIDVGAWVGQGVEEVAADADLIAADGEKAAEPEEKPGEHEPLLITIKDFIVLLGGLFLVGKAVYEIHDKLEGNDHAAGVGVGTAAFSTIILQILALDLVFSIDSVITAVGIAEYLSIMIVAVMIAVVVMITFAGPISRFVEKHPTTKILALSFLILIGVLLVAEAFEQKIPKGYIYFSLAFALLVEFLNIQFKKAKNRGKPVKLHQSYVDSESSDGYGDIAKTS
jgi:predicted tellurium resistance membrane protein TerC